MTKPLAQTILSGRRPWAFPSSVASGLTVDTFCTYEQHFGLSGRPFSTNADPDFYFESRGHGQVLVNVMNALAAGDCFVVVTGEPGAGKTMLVRELLREMESEGILSTLPPAAAELDARGVLRAILSSFRARTEGDSLDDLRAAVHRHLTALDSLGGKAVIVVDDAQRLPPDAIDELIRFAAPQWTDDATLAVLLVGEPALRESLPDVTQLTPRPTVLFCDVGVLSRAETRAYVEHRLKHVQWRKSPSFSDAAHERIHGATGGVTLQVNRLCNALLIAASSRQLTSISPELVEETSAEWRDEARESAPADVLSMPVFVPESRFARFVPRIREGVASYGWLALPILVVAGLIGSPSEKSVISPLLAAVPARGTVNVAQTAVGQTPSPLVAPLPLQVMLAAQLDEVRARVARDARAKRNMVVGVRRGAERTATVVTASEAQRVAGATSKGEGSRASRVASDARKKRDADRTSGSQLASRGRT